jgi:hypothetical protein
MGSTAEGGRAVGVTVQCGGEPCALPAGLTGGPGRIAAQAQLEASGAAGHSAGRAASTLRTGAVPSTTPPSFKANGVGDGATR